MTLSRGPRINARTLHRIHLGISQQTLDCTLAKMRFQGRDITSESIISAILADFLTLPMEVRLKYLFDQMKPLETEAAGVKLSTGPRLNARTAHAIHFEMQIVRDHAAARGISFQKRPVTNESIVSAILRAFLSMPAPDRLAYLAKHLPALESLVNGI